MVSLQLFRNSLFVTGTSISAIIALGQAGLGFSIPVYLQAVLKLDPIHTGLALIPLALYEILAFPLIRIFSLSIWKPRKATSFTFATSLFSRLTE